MAYTRKSFEERGASNYLLEEDRGISYTSYAHPPKPGHNARGRYGSNQKKYDYQNQINDSREVRARTPSAGDYTKYKYDSNALASTEPEISTGISHGKLKRIAKNYAAGIGNTNFGEFNPNQKQKSKSKYMNIKDEPIIVEMQRKQNINMRNYDLNNTHQFDQPNRSYERRQKEVSYERRDKDRSYQKRFQEEDPIKQSFERTNEQKIFQKITRINKLNSEINDKLQKILAKVSSD